MNSRRAVRGKIVVIIIIIIIIIIIYLFIFFFFSLYKKNRSQVAEYQLS